MLKTVAPEKALYKKGYEKQYPNPPGAPDQILPVSILQFPFQEPLFCPLLVPDKPAFVSAPFLTNQLPEVSI